jgi:hypothetical protein
MIVYAVSRRLRHPRAWGAARVALDAVAALPITLSLLLHIHIHTSLLSPHRHTSGTPFENSSQTAGL